jgi:hypothetical protein
MNARQRRFVRRNRTEIIGNICNDTRSTFVPMLRPVSYVPYVPHSYHIWQSIRRGLLRVGMFVGVKADAQEA